ncbi:fungal-specific transcription factor domain-containing protein [Aspergillus crustosus]
MDKVKKRRTREDRRRTARACDRCWRLKERCEGGIPCTRCIHLSRQCEFKRLDSQPRTSDQAQVNVHELLERVMYMETILKHKVKGIVFDLDHLRRTARALAEDENQDENEHEQDVPQPSLPPEEDPIEEEVYSIDPVEDTTTHSFQVSNYWRAEQLHSGLSGLSVAIACCPPRHVADYLVNVFFKHAATFYFYVDKDWLNERLDALYDHPEKFSKKSVAVLSIILAVFAIATQYAYLDSPSHTSATNAGSELPGNDLGTMFYRQAIRFLPEIIEASSLESVQACLLFAAYALPVDASGLGYIYLTLTVRLAMQNGMHRRYRGTGLSAAMIDTRDRVWWTAYTLERRVSIGHGRPLSTVRSDVNAQLPSSVQGDGVLSTTPYLVASILLTQRLEEFSHEMFLLRNCQKQERPPILARLVTAKHELETWWSSLPEEIHTNAPQHHVQFRAIQHLRLEYCLVRMFIGRPLLLNRHSTSPSAPSSPEGSAESPSKTSNSGHRCDPDRQELVNGCVQAAKEALGLCRALRDNGPGLARNSYVEYSSCRASLLILIAHSIQDPSVKVRTELREGLDMIREMAAAGESARSEVELIESFERALARLHYIRAKNSNNTDTDSKVDSDYEHFRNWESMWKSVNTNNMLEIVPWGMSQSQPAQDWAVEPPGFQAGPATAMSSSMQTRRPYATDAFALDSGATPTQSDLQTLQEVLGISGYRFDNGFAADSGYNLG